MAMPIARRFLFRLSPASSKRVFTEISNYVRGPKVQWHGRSFSAAVSSDKPIRKGEKVPSKERKVMVESFVNRYRETHLGKFPTPSMAMKEVGGSYYIIRKIIQELIAEAKMSSVDTMYKISQGKELTKENEPSTEGEDIASSQIITYEPLHENATRVPVNGLDIPDSNKHLQMKVAPETSSLDENVNSKNFVKPTETGDDTHQVATEKDSEVLHPRPKKTKINTEDKTREDVLDFDVPLHKPEQEYQPDLEKLTRKLAERQKDEELLKSESQTDEELQKKPSMWGNLKSLADGIINIWRKL